MSSRALEARQKKLLCLVGVYGRPISRKGIHRLVKTLQEEYGVELGYNFSQGLVFSRELDEDIASLTERGYLKVLYAAGGRYLSLYRPFYALTERGRSALTRKDFSKTDAEKIERAIGEILKPKREESAPQSPTRAPEQGEAERGREPEGGLRSPGRSLLPAAGPQT